MKYELMQLQSEAPKTTLPNRSNEDQNIKEFIRHNRDSDRDYAQEDIKTDQKVDSVSHLHAKKQELTPVMEYELMQHQNELPKTTLRNRSNRDQKVD
jgi:hypothetical protein